MRIAIKVVRSLDDATIQELAFEVPADRRIGHFVDEVFEKLWPEMEAAGASIQVDRRSGRVRTLFFCNLIKGLRHPSRSASPDLASA